MSFVQNIDPDTLKSWLEKGETLLIDVRERDEYNQVRIPLAINMPLSEFDPDDVPQTEGKTIVFQCHSGKRSERACSFFLEDFPDYNAFNLDGGIQAWYDLGYKIERDA